MNSDTFFGLRTFVVGVLYSSVDIPSFFDALGREEKRESNKGATQQTMKEENKANKGPFSNSGFKTGPTKLHPNLAKRGFSKADHAGFELLNGP